MRYLNTEARGPFRILALVSSERGIRVVQGGVQLSTPRLFPNLLKCGVRRRSTSAAEGYKRDNESQSKWEAERALA